MKNELLKISAALVLTALFSGSYAQDDNPNWTESYKGTKAEASSYEANPPSNVQNYYLQQSWVTKNETKGAWVKLTFNKKCAVKEIMILPVAVPYDIILDPYTRTEKCLAPKSVTISFSDGTKIQAAFQPKDYFHIIALPEEKTTEFIKVTIDELWPGTENKTGIGKIWAYPKEHKLAMNVFTFDMFDFKNNKPVKSALVEYTNPGSAIEDAHLVLKVNNKPVDDVALGTLTAKTMSICRIWINSPYTDEDCEVFLQSGTKTVFQSKNIKVTAYKKTYFEGGEFNINNTNHNDLGWLGTQLETADYRSSELILPAMKIMETNPEFYYTMESVEYLKEFLVRHPEKKDEMAKLMRDRHFTFGGSYVQMLQDHVGPEKLARQFYYGRRWLKENFPGADTKIYSNADVPCLSYQLPQILKSAGIEYMLQGRITLGYYNWQGLDGTIIHLYGYRYGGDILNPKNNEGWIKYLFAQEQNYESHNLPKVFNYDFNSDYIPPCPELVPYVKEQNEAMKNFAADWNKHFTEKEKQIQPPVLKFTNPEDMLKEIYSDPNINIETMKGTLPLSWAYYDEPSNREALLTGRKAHNMLLSAEKLYSSMKQLDPSIVYPKASFDSAWLLNCWPDHGWGGNKGLQTDSIYFDHYKQSYKMAQSLMEKSIQILCSNISGVDKKQIPLVVYNPLNWKRTEPVHASIMLPSGWAGFTIKDQNGKMISFELTEKKANQYDVVFIAENIPSTGYSTYFVVQAKNIESPVKNLTGDSISNSKIKIVFGKTGIKQITDKVNKRDFLKTEKFEAGEIIQFSAPGNAWDDWGSHEDVNMEDFDKSTNHESKGHLEKLLF